MGISRAEIQEKLIDLILEKKLVSDKDSIDGNTPVKSIFNSITFIQFLVAMEKAFDFEFDDEDLDIDSIEDINDIIDKIQELTI